MSDLPDTWRPALPSQAIREDYHYLREVVRVGFPVREALVFLARHLGNPISYRLVEVLRGEKPGIIRAVEVQAATGGEPTYVRALRLLPDGSLASYFTPEDLVRVETEVVTPDGRPAPPLGPRDTVLLHVPVRGYLRYLPGLYQGAVPAQRRDVVRADEVCVTELANEVGMKPQAVSNQLQRLSSLGIIEARRAGVNVHYRVVDLCVRSLLDQGLCLTEEATRRNRRG
jgi:DNA-binding transcriptional ArsR family regulator